MCAFWQFPFILLHTHTHTHIFPRRPSLLCSYCPASAGWMRINVTDRERERERRVRLCLGAQSQIVESPWQHNSSTQAPLRASRYPIRATATWACLRDDPSLHWSLNQDWGSPPRRESGKETQPLDWGWTLVQGFWCKIRPPTDCTVNLITGQPSRSETLGKSLDGIERDPERQLVAYCWSPVRALLEMSSWNENSPCFLNACFWSDSEWFIRAYVSLYKIFFDPFTMS